MNIYELWKKKEVQLFIDICRILLLIMVVLIFYKLVTEIEAVKLLNYDPCKLCMNKTGAICTCFYADTYIEKDAEGREVRIIKKKIPVYPEINVSELEELLPE